jgi:ParB family chromosome partitioning protein
MTDRRRGLGRGLGALIPTAPLTAEPSVGEEAPEPTPLGSYGAPVSAPSVPQVAQHTEPSGGYGAPSSTTMVDAPRPASSDDGGLAGLPRERGVALGELIRPQADLAASPVAVPEITTHEPPADASASAATPARSVASPQREPDMAVVPGARFAELPIDSITPNPHQPREVFDEEAMAELVHSIGEVGLLQPIVVRELTSGAYELIMGERRWRASRQAGLTRIPAIVRDTTDDRMLLDALLENLHRSQLNPLEEAAAYDQLLRDFSCTHEELAARIGRSRSQVSNTLRLLKLPPSVQRRVAANVLSAGHARALLSLEDPDEQERLASRIVAEGLSVRAVEEIVALNEPTKAPRKPRAGRRLSPALQDIATRLSDHFETRVRVDLGQKRGKIIVEFASVEDLERIVAAMSPRGAEPSSDTAEEADY